MTRGDLARFIALAALWGGSFLFMRVAAPEFGPATLMLARCVIGAAVLLPVLLVRRRGAAMVAVWRPMIILGLINSALPFVLFGYAALTLKSGLISVLNSTAPFWGVLIAWFWLGERLTRWQYAGLLAGFFGVFILVTGGHGFDGLRGGDKPLAVAACLLATLSYGVSASFTRRFLSNADPLANAAGSQISASLWLLVPGLWFWPQTMPSTPAMVSVVVLGVFSTGIAYLIFFRLIADLGAGRAITVTFAVPLFGVVWGAWILGEVISVSMVVGGAIVITGCALTTGVLAPGRGAKASQA